MAKTIQEVLAHGNGKEATSDGHAIEYVQTVEAYNKWAEVYDTDGNFLQALDTIEMRDLLPRFVALVQAQAQTEVESNKGEKVLKLVDLGCGTGRNTQQLANTAPGYAQIIGLDASPGMLEVAGKTLRGLGAGNRVTLGVYDLLSPSESVTVSLPGSLRDQLGSGASGVISTLVLEHIPADKFFEGAARLIRPGGYFLVTNMHAEMGSISQAGFVDVKTGMKIRPTSYAHEVSDVVAAAERVGFEVVALDEGGERLRARRVDEAMVEGLGGRARKWVGVTVWFAVCFRMRFR
ncbi:S-adenosyl-L-methionine-dependent methyltransferase [Aspergillus aurantiobrunneus]